MHSICALDQNYQDCLKDNKFLTTLLVVCVNEVFQVVLICNYRFMNASLCPTT